MHPQTWLEKAMGAPSRVRILRLLAAEPDRIWTQREVARAIGMSPNGVNKAIRELHACGILEIRKLGPVHAVRLQRRLASQIGRLFDAERNAWQATLEAIRASVPVDTACYLFGSTAHGRPSPDSDLDLLVVARDREAADDAAYAIHVKVLERFPATLEIIALGADEARRRARKGVVRSAITRGTQLSARSLADVS